MLFQGMAAAIRLRERWPAIPITETHPKALHFALRKATYPEAETWEPEQDICRWLLDALGHPEGAPINTSDQWDALASAWAAYMGHSGAWSADLMRAARRPILPAEPVHYWWPVDLRDGKGRRHWRCLREHGPQRRSAPLHFRWWRHRTLAIRAQHPYSRPLAWHRRNAA